MAGTIVVDRIESDSSYASSINIASNIVVGKTTISFNASPLNANSGIQNVAANAALTIYTTKSNTMMGQIDDTTGILLVATANTPNVIYDIGPKANLNIDFAMVDDNSLINGIPQVRIGMTQAYNAGVDSDPLYESSGYFRVATRSPGGSAGVLRDNLIVYPEGYVRMPRQPAFQVYWNSSSYSISANGTNDIIRADTVEVDITGSWSTTTNSYTAPVTGTYIFHICLGLDLTTGSSGSDDTFFLTMAKNGSRYNASAANNVTPKFRIPMNRYLLSVGVELAQSVTFMVTLNAGDYVQFYASDLGPSVGPVCESTLICGHLIG